MTGGIVTIPRRTVIGTGYPGPTYAVSTAKLRPGAVTRRNLVDERCTPNADQWRSVGWSVHVLGRS